MPLLWLVACFVSGVYVESLAAAPGELLAMAAAVPAATAFLWRRSPVIRLAALCVLAALLGAARFQATIPQVGPGDAAYYVGQQSIRLRGVVTEPPDVRDASTNLRLSVSEVQSGGEWRLAGGLVQATVGRFPAYAYGDLLELAGNLEQPPVFEDFSYKDYLARQGVLAVTYRPRVWRLAQNQANPLVSALLFIRDRAQEAITAALPDPQAALTVGVLLGVKAALPRDFSDDLQAVGLTHIVVVSGFNLTIVAGFLRWLASKRFGPRASAAAAVFGVLLFALMVGATGAVIRSAIMVTLSLAAVGLGRQNDGLNSLGMACGIMVAWWPPQLWDVGFQLSAAATFGLIWLAPVLERRLTRLPEALRGNLAVALAAQAMTMPMLVSSFHLISLVSPLANLAALWAVGPLMACGLVVALVGQLSAQAAAVVAWAAWLFATWITGFVRILADLPWAAAPVPPVSGFWWVGYFGLLWLAVRRWGLQPDPPRPAARPAHTPAFRARVALVVLGVAALLVWAAVVTLPDRQFRVSFLDVGEGDAILIQTRGGQTILVDGGPSPSALTSALGTRLPFWSRRLDLVVLTHPNDDHLLGLVEVLRRYQVAEVLEPGLPDPAPAYAAWLGAIEQQGIHRQIAEAGQRVDLEEGAWIEVLAPAARSSAMAPTDANNASVILRLVVGKVAFLLTGDVETPGEKELLRRGLDLSSDVLKVPHHGSRLALDPEFLQAVDPAVAVISVGAGNRNGHPTAEALDRLKDTTVYRTDRAGTVEVITDGKTVEIRTEK